MKKEKVKKTKIKFSLWRLLSYIGCYILVTFAVGFTVVSVNSSTYSFTPPSLNDDTNVSSSLLGNMVTNIMSLSDVTATINVEVENGENVIRLNGDINAKIYEEFSGVEANGNFVVTYNGTSVNLGFTYKDNLYVSLNGRTFVVDVNNAIEGVAGILNAIGVEFDLDISSITSKLDMSILDTLGDYIKEEKLDDGYKLVAEYKGLSAEVLLDKEYNIISVTTPKLDINGWKIKLGVNIDKTNQGLVIDKVEGGTTLNPLLKLAKNAINTINDKNLYIKSQIQYDQYSVDVDTFINGDNMQISTNVLGQQIDIYYVSNSVYFDLGFVQFKISKSDIDTIKDIVAKFVPDDIIKTMSTKLTLEDIVGICEKLISENWNIAGDDDSFVLNYGENAVTVNYIDDKISSVDIDVLGAKGSVSIESKVKNIVVPDYQYICLDDAMEIVDAVQDLIENKYINANLSLTVKDIDLDVKVLADLNTMRVHLSTSVFGKDIAIDYVDNVAYVSVDGLNLAFEKADIISIVEKALSQFDIDTNFDFANVKIEKADIEKMVGLLKDLKINKTQSGYDLVYGDHTVKVGLNDGDISSLQYNDLVSVEFEMQAPQFETIDKDIYQYVDVSVENITRLIDEVKSYIDGKTYCFDIVASYKDYTVSGFVGLKDNLLNGHLESRVYGKDVCIDIIANELFVKVDDLKIKCVLSDYDKVRVLLQDKFGIVLPKMDFENKDIFEKSDKTNKEEITVDKIQDLFKDFSISNYGMMLVVEYKDYVIKIDLADYNVNSIKLNGFGTDIIVTPVEYKTTSVSGEYIEASGLINFANEIIEYIDASEYYFDIDVQYDKYHVVGWIGLDNGHIVGHLDTVVLNKNLQIDILDDVLYIDFDGLRLKCVFADYGKIKDLFESEWDIILPELNLLDPLSMIPKTDFDMSKIAGIIDKISISNIGQILTVNYDSIKAVIDLTDYKLNKVVLSMDRLSATVKPTSPQTAVVENEYIDIASLTKVAKAVNKSMANMTMSGVLKVDIVFGDEENHLDINYGITYQDKDLKAYANFTFKGIEVNVYYTDETLYFDVVGMKFYANISDYKDIIAWLNERFDLNINVDDLENGLNKGLDDISLDFIKSWEISDSHVKANIFDKVTIDVDYSDTIDKVVFMTDTKSATIICKSFDPVVFESIDNTEYSKYTVVTNTIDDILNTIKKKSFNISATARAYENGSISHKADVSLVFDFASHFKAFGFANVQNVNDPNSSIELMASWDKDNGVDTRDYLFVDFNGMKLKVNADALKEMVSLALQVFGVSPSVLGFLDDVNDDFIIESDNLNAIMPNLDMGNPLNMLRYIKSLSLKDSIFTMVLDGSFFGDGVDDMQIILHTNNGTISGLDLNNIYVGGSKTFNLNILLNPFVSVNSVSDKSSFMDLSNASELLKAFVNTSANHSYHIKGKVKLNIIGIDGLATVGVDAGITLDDDKKVTADVTLSNYPLYLGVNTAYSNYSAPVNRMRTINMRFKGGYVYVKINDAKYLTAKAQERVTKVPVSYMLENLDHYMQYILGFTDSIQSKIVEAVTASKNYTGKTNYGNILLGYDYLNRKHTITLNLKELAHNDQVNTMEIGLTTINNRQTNRKDMLYRLDINVKLLDDKISILTDDSNNLKLIDLNSVYDMSATNSYISGYTFDTFGEYSKEGNGSYSKQNNNSVKVSFYTLEGKSLGSVNGHTCDEIVYPSIERTLADGRVFKGWYYYSDDAKTKLKEWNETRMPLNNIDLYAVWENIYTVTLQNGTEVVDTFTLFKGERHTLNALDDRFVEKDGVRSGQKFAGWYDGLIRRTEIVAKTQDVTLKAHWEDSTYYQVKFVDGETTTEKWVRANETLALDPKSNYISTIDGEEVVYEWRGWYLDDQETSEIVVDRPITLVARWQICSIDMTRKLNIYDGDTLLSSTPQLVDYLVNVPAIEKINDETLFYLDKEFSTPYEFGFMPDYDLNVYIQNVYTITIKYYDSITNGVVKTATKQVLVRQGESLVDVYPDASRLATGKNASGQLVYMYDDTQNKTKEVTYTYLGLIGKVDIMPNSDIEVEEDWEKSERQYFDIVFDTEYRYHPLGMTRFNQKEYKDAPFTPSALREKEGTYIDLSGSSYKPSCSIALSKWTTYHYNCSGWSLSVPNDASNGGGMQSYTVNSGDANNGTITLYVCWKKA